MRRLTASLLVILCGSAVPAVAGGPPAFPSALPPVANPGECYAQVRIPAEYATSKQVVVTAEAHSKIDVTQPQFQSREATVLTKEPSVRYIVRQPTYRTITERIVTRPGHDRLSVAPPQFSTVAERLQTRAPHLVWKRGNPGELQRQGYVIHSTADGRLRTPGDYRGGSHATTQQGGDSCGPGCEIWCLVEEPGTSMTTTRRVMTAPSRVIRTPVAPQTRMITKQVVADPGGVEQVPVPAEYARVTIEELVRPAEAYETHIPEQYGTVPTKDLIRPERYEWRRVLCAPGTGGGTVSGQLSGGYTSHHSSAPQSYTPYTAPQSQPKPKQGYYGTENFPAYKHRAPHRKRR